MSYHPADGPRLNTLYVTHSTRKRKRRTSARRRRRSTIVSLVALAGVVAMAVVFREPLARRLDHVLNKQQRAATLARDVTVPSGAANVNAPDVRQAGTQSPPQA